MLKMQIRQKKPGTNFDLTTYSEIGNIELF